MAITSFKGFVDAQENGQTFIGGFRKTITTVTGGGVWFDTTLSQGNPLPFYYASTPLAGVPISQSVNGGIPHNQPVASLGYQTYLKTITLTPTGAGVNAVNILCDYLFYYPFVDTGTTDEQVLDNTLSLTRYTTGQGVSVMAVQMAGMLGAGNPTFRFTYYNQSGVLQTSPTQTCGTASAVGELATGNNSVSSVNSAYSNYPFLSLAPGDTGIRSVESVTFDTPDIGLLAFVLVKPLEQICLRESGASAERTPAIDFFDLPIIADNAYLSILVSTGNTSASSNSFIGTIQTVWG